MVGRMNGRQADLYIPHFIIQFVIELSSIGVFIFISESDLDGPYIVKWQKLIVIILC